MAEKGETMMYDPTSIGAAFENGRIRAMTFDWSRLKETIRVKDIMKDMDRSDWVLENMRVFNDGTMAFPEANWKSIIDFNIAELKVAAQNAKLLNTPEGRKKVEKTEHFLKAAMAVSSSARAMEASAGVPEVYTVYITQSSPPNPDRQDTWAEFLLHKDPMKIQTVLENETVNYFYKKIIDDVGMDGVLKRDDQGEFVFDERTETKNRFIENWENFNREQALKSKLLRYITTRVLSPKNWDETKRGDWAIGHLTKKEREKMNKELESKLGRRVRIEDEREEAIKNWEAKKSLNEYIWDILLTDENLNELKKKLKKEENKEKKEEDFPVLWSAAKLATDTFLVDKYTRWEHELNTAEFDEKDHNLINKPCPWWGGDPLGAMIDPSFLPRVVKGVFAKDEAGKVITTMINKAFRPDDLEYKINDKDGNEIPIKMKDKIEEELPCSMTIHLKSYYRYNKALWTFLGEKSRALGIASWDKKVLGEDLPSIILELLDEVYGKFKVKTFKKVGDKFEKVEDKTFNRELMGLITARILECKALAAAYASASPGFKENMAYLFGDLKSARPFYEVEQFIWGPKLDTKAGFLSSLADPRTRFIFDNQNRFSSEKILRNTWEILATNDQDPRGRGRAKLLTILGHFTDFIQAVGSQMKK